MGGRGRESEKKALTFWLKSKGGAVADEGADNSQGELFTPTEDGWVGRLVGTESWYQRQDLVCCAQAPTVHTNTAGVSGGRMRKSIVVDNIGVYPEYPTEVRASWEFER